MPDRIQLRGRGIARSSLLLAAAVTMSALPAMVSAVVVSRNF